MSIPSEFSSSARNLSLGLLLENIVFFEVAVLANLFRKFPELMSGFLQAFLQSQEATQQGQPPKPLTDAFSTDPNDNQQPPVSGDAHVKVERGHYQSASSLLGLHHAFNLRASSVGAATAFEEFRTKVSTSTLSGWREKLGSPLPEGRVRREGGGCKPVFSHASLIAVHEAAIKLRDSAPVSFVQLRHLFAQQPHQDPESTKSKHFKCSDNFVRQWMTDFKFTLELKHHQDDKAIVQDTREQLQGMLKEVYAFRLHYLTLHVPAAARNLSLEPFMTLHRILNFDEINITFMPNDDVQETFTAGLLTDAQGDIKMPLLCFHGTTQLENPIQLVDGHAIFEAYNDTHWNNALLFEQYLQAVFSSVLPCGCGRSECKAYCLLVDLFSGHFSAGIALVCFKYGIKLIVCKYTPEGQPNDDKFNGLIKAGMRAHQRDFWRKRALLERERKDRGDDLLPTISRAENRDMQKRFMIDTCYDPDTKQTRRKLRDCLRKVYRRRGLTVDLRGSDRKLAHVQLQDGSLLDLPLPDLALLPDVDIDTPLAHQLPDQPDVDVMRVQGVRSMRKRLQAGDASFEELANEASHRRSRRAQSPVVIVEGQDTLDTETGKKDDGVDEALFATTISDLLPPDHQVLQICPDLQDVLGHTIAWKWDVGWERGKVVKAKPRARKHNFEVLIESEALPRNMMLGTENYSAQDTAPAGSWVCMYKAIKA